MGVLLGDDALLPEPAVLLADSCCDLIAIPAALDGICNEMISYGTPSTKWHLIRNRANETNTYIAFANVLGFSGIFSPDMYDLTLPEALGDRTVRPCCLELDLREIVIREGIAPFENITRSKPMIAQRDPRFYRPLYMKR